MKIVIYTGTSISQAHAKKILDAEYHSPVRRNDIKKLMKNPPNIIGIIDGGFFESAAVAHREIIEALKNGITVVGGGSMGALRASELDTYGMIGVGKIYEMYKNGILESDDEVAVTYDEETLKPLSVPLINVRMTIDKAETKKLLTHEQAFGLIDVTKKIFYPERNYQNILIEALKKGIITDFEKSKLLEFCKNYEVDIKREDSILVLEKIKELKQSLCLLSLDY